jgi:hypothetical protein
VNCFNYGILAPVFLFFLPTKTRKQSKKLGGTRFQFVLAFRGGNGWMNKYLNDESFDALFAMIHTFEKTKCWIGPIVRRRTISIEILSGYGKPTRAKLIVLLLLFRQSALSPPAKSPAWRQNERNTQHLCLSLTIFTFRPAMTPNHVRRNT